MRRLNVGWVRFLSAAAREKFNVVLSIRKSSSHSVSTVSPVVRSNARPVSPRHKEQSSRFRCHSGAIVNAKTRSGFALAIEPGISRLLEKDASQWRKPISGFRVQGLRPCPGMTVAATQ
jgi:hypothetical protein